MRVGLFIPCYVDQFYPHVGIATLELLEKLGVEVVYPKNQTCCGQPMANSGYQSLSQGCSDLFIKNFNEFDYIVSPSGSCVLYLREHLQEGADHHDPAYLGNKVYELTSFLTDVLKVDSLPASFPHKVGMHQSCHGQRGLHLSSMSELVAPAFSKPGSLLSMVKDIELIELSRIDECCGFGGTFCVAEEAVSVKMGKDRVADHLEHGAEYITGVDMSCLMHMEGILHRQGSKVKVLHIAQILNGIEG